MPWTRLADVDIYWESYGRGRPVLLISGVGGGTWSWQQQIEALSPRFRVLVFDNLGGGRSSMPDRPYSIGEMAQHGAAVLGAAREDCAHLLGLSMGGMIVQEMALQYPEKVASLVLGCTHCGGQTRIPPDPEVIARFADNEGLSPEQIVDKNLALLVNPEFLRSPPPALQRFRDQQLQAPLQPEFALQRQLEAIRKFDACDRIDKIHSPTLIITGGKDRLVPPENGKLLASRIPGAREVCLADAGHLIQVECARAFHETVLEFLEETKRDFS